MLFEIYNPPVVEAPKTPEPTLILPTSINEVGCITMAAYTINPSAAGANYLTNTVVRGNTINGGHLREVSFSYLGDPVKKHEILSGEWQVLSSSIEDRGKSWGLVQRIG